MDLTNIVDAEWRVYPATALAFYGLALLANGLWFGFRGSNGLLKERDALGWMRGFRLAVVGLCLVGIAIAWVWHILWLFVAAVGIMGEELLETSVIIEVLKRAPASRNELPHPLPPARGRRLMSCHPGSYLDVNTPLARGPHLHPLRGYPALPCAGEGVLTSG